MTGTAHRPLVEAFSTGTSWIARAIVVSAFLHVVVATVWWFAHRPSKPTPDYVDIEVAPPPPKAEALPAEVAKPPETSPAATAATPAAPPEPGAANHGEDTAATMDAGIDAPIDASIDAPIDARPKQHKHPDAAQPMIAGLDDAGAGADADDGTALARADSGGPSLALADAGASGVALTDAGVPGGADAGTAVALLDDAGHALALLDDARHAPVMLDGSAVATATVPGYQALPGTGAGSALGSGAGSSIGPGGLAAATNEGSGAGVAGVDNQPAVEGAPTSAGTAANLLSYFPAGHQITVLVRFDRLRSTEWADPAEKLFQPMPDYKALFGDRDAKIHDKIESLVISTPRPRDATATTLVVHSSLSRVELRSFLTNTDTPIKWSTTNGGLYGTRGGKLFPGDKRVLLSPWKDWIVLAQPDDVVGLTTATKGNVDTAEVSAKTKLPPWLASIRSIEQESEDPAAAGTTTGTGAVGANGDARATGANGGAKTTGANGGAKTTGAKAPPTRGPALVLTLAGPGKRYKFPDVLGLGITSAPSPVRLSLAMELVKQGWLVRGNIVFANEADATEFVKTAHDMQERINDSRFLSGLLKKQHAYNAVAGFSTARSGARVSYATSISIADARAVLAVMAATLDDYFQAQQP